MLSTAPLSTASLTAELLARPDLRDHGGPARADNNL